MRRNMLKGAVALLVVVMTICMASSAFALVLNARSEEMTANSTCDLAGTIEIKFTETDFNLIRAYLDDVNTPKLNASGINTAVTPGVQNYVLIRATLGGENIALDSQPPILCKDITGDTSEDGAQGASLPNSGKLVVLDVMGTEVSDVTNNVQNPGGGPVGDNDPDVTAYVYGKSGNQYFSIYVTDIQQATDWDDESTWPWIKVGLYEEVLGIEDGFDTAICANVVDFGALAILDVSLDIEPTSLTYTTSDNQIGHFLPGDVDLRDCEKGETCDHLDTESIELCPLGSQATCESYYKCVIAEGTYPSSGQLKFIVRTNGATNNANTQEGVYIANVSMYNESGSLLPGTGWIYREDDGTTRVSDTNCTWEAEYAENSIQSGDLDGDEIRLCIVYQVNPAEADADTTVQIWIQGTTVPCGDLFSEVISAADLVECGEGSSCMYFPYTLSGSSWAMGIAVANLSSTVAVEDMEVTVKLTSADGTTKTAVLPDSIVTGKVFAFTMDSLVTTLGWEVPAGASWLFVQGNFPIDGYSFLYAGNSAGVFGAGTLPRLLSTCESFSSLK